jgi:hypothetical protein
VEGIRYFKRLSIEGGPPLWVSRIVLDNDEETIVGQKWNGTAWADLEIVMDDFVNGDPMTDEITEAEARRLVPDTFA